MKKIIIIVASLLLALNTAFAANFVAGKDYTIVNPKAPKQKQVKVIEFFNYGCPWCAHVDPTVEKWLKAKPKFVDFTRVSVAFEAGWDTYSKAFYLAEALGIEAKITPRLFKAIHGSNGQKYNDLSSTKAISHFLVKHGVKQSIVKNTFNTGSASLDLKIKQSLPLMQSYKIYGIPSFVIADKYTVSLAQAKTPKKLMQTVNYLVTLAHKK